MAAAAIVASTPAAPPAEAASQRHDVGITVRHAQPAYSPDATFTVAVAADLAQRTEYFEVRLRLTSPSGRLLYQKTEIRHNAPAGRLTIAFSRSLTGLGVRQGRYPVELRVLATGRDPVTIRSRILVLTDPTRVRVPVAVIARLAGPPALDPEGRFATDPALYPRPRSDAERLLDAANRHPSSTLVLAAAPVLLEEWLRTSDGYEVIEPSGTRAVPPEDPTAIASAATIRRLKDAVAARRVELLDVPYAEPDYRQFDADTAANDFSSQWALSDAVFARAVAASPARGAALFASPVPQTALEQVRARKDRFVILPVDTLREGDATAAPGAYRLPNGLVALTPDPALAEAAHADDADAFFDALFARAISAEPSSPVLALFELGPGAAHTAADVERALTWIESAPWVASVSASQAASESAPQQAVVNASAPLTPPVAPYRTEVSRARSSSEALVEALGTDDADARTALWQTLVSESTLWAGADGTYPLRERAAAFARAAQERAQRLFDGIGIDAKDVTLPDVSGEIPISIVNKTDKAMRLTLLADASRASVHGTPKTITVQPGENVVAIAVDVRGEVGDRIRVSLASGTVTIASDEILVKASYLNRIVTMLGVVLFLSALLAYIRRRALRVEAGGTIAPGDTPESSRPANGT